MLTVPSSSYFQSKDNKKYQGLHGDNKILKNYEAKYDKGTLPIKKGK
jgi:hypothetical protein